MFDQEYLNRLARGDFETGQHFAHYFDAMLLKKVRSRCLPGDLADDVRQETLLRMLRIIRGKGGIQYPERLAGYVNGVCENVIAEMFRARSRYSQPPEEPHESCDQAGSAELAVLLEERSLLIRSILSKLSQTDQVVLGKTFLEDGDNEQVCHELGLRPAHLRVRIHRALRRLRAVIRGADEAALRIAVHSPAVG